MKSYFSAKIPEASRNGSKTQRKSAWKTLALTALALGAGSLQAQTYIFSNTTAGTYNWSTGSGWDALPVSGSNTVLTIFSPNGTVVSAGSSSRMLSNDLGAFSLNQLNLQGTGPTTGSNPTVNVNLSGGALVFEADGATGPSINLNANWGDAANRRLNYNIANNLTLNADLLVNRPGNATFNFSGVISGAGGITFAGAGSGLNNGGTVVLAGNNTYTGKTSIGGGRVSISSIGSVGSASSGLGSQSTVADATVDLGNGTTAGTLIYTGAGETTDRVINLAGTTGGGVLMANNATGLLKFTSDLSVTGAGNKSLTLNGTGVGEFGGVIADGADAVVSLVKSQVGTWTLTEANTYSGGTTIGENGGYLLVTHASALGTGNVTINTSNSGPDSRAGTLQLANNIALTGPSEIILASGGRPQGGKAQIENLSGNNSYAGNIAGASSDMVIGSVSGKLTLSGTLTSTFGGGSGNRTLFLQGDGDGEFSGQILRTDVARPLAISKSGAGTWIFSNDETGTSRNNYKGTTTVNAGTILINTDHSLVTGANIVNATGTLGGNGIIGGITEIKSDGTLSAGADHGVAGVLTFNANLTQETGSHFQWELLGNTDSGAGRGTDYDGIDFSGSRVLTIETGVVADLVFNGAGSSVNWTDAFWNSDRTWLVYYGATLSQLSDPIFGTINVSLDAFGNSFSVTGGSFSFEQVGEDVYLNYEAIPEPSSGLLLGLGLGALWMGRRRNR